MNKVLKNSWALFLGMGCLMMAYGFQGSLLGVRAVQEEFSLTATGFMMSGYFVGYFIQQNIYKEINITDLLKISTMSKSSFYRAFAEELGISPYQLIIDERLKISKKLLLEEKLSIKETAYASGFSSSNYFIRLFKKNEGLTPKQFMTSKLVHPK